MYIESNRLIIKDFDLKDRFDLFRMIYQNDVVKFMKDWSDEIKQPDDFNGFINYMRSKSDCKDIRINKRYGVYLKETLQIVGMVGMGLEDTLNEVEMAYFIDDAYKGNGYAAEAVEALFQWCMSISDQPYMILTIDSANYPSHRVAVKAGFELFEIRKPVGHIQPNMVSDTYHYYRRLREV